MATHSSILAWRIPGMGEPGGLQSMVLHRVRHDWSDLTAAAAEWSTRIFLSYFDKVVVVFLVCCLFQIHGGIKHSLKDVPLLASSQLLHSTDYLQADNNSEDLGNTENQDRKLTVGHNTGFGDSNTGIHVLSPKEWWNNISNHSCFLLYSPNICFWFFSTQ